MKILVTGGAGFIGSHVVDAYVEDGHDVVIIDNLSTGKRENVNPRAKFYKTDICDPDVANIFSIERPEVLNHHAAQMDIRKSVADPHFDLRVNVGGFINLLEAAKDIGLRKVILASSGGAIYGEQETFPAAEDHPTRPISPYGLNKLASEQYLHYYESVYGVSWVALRYANVYGPRQNSLGEAGVVAIFTANMLSGRKSTINGDGRQTRDYVYVADVVEANRLALREQAARVYNVGTGVETDVNSIFRILKGCAGSNCPAEYGPARPGEQRRSSILSAELNNRLGWKSTVPLEDGIQKTVEWFRKTQV